MWWYPNTHCWGAKAVYDVQLNKDHVLVWTKSFKNLWAYKANKLVDQCFSNLYEHWKAVNIGWKNVEISRCTRLSRSVTKSSVLLKKSERNVYYQLWKIVVQYKVSSTVYTKTGKCNFYRLVSLYSHYKVICPANDWIW